MPGTNSPTAAFTVSGHIYDKYDHPLPGVSVEAVEVDAVSQRNIGAATTDGNGFYTITYSVQQFAANEYKGVDVKIIILHNNGAAVFQSPTYFNVGQNTVIDFKIDDTPYKDINKFEPLSKKLPPFIKKVRR